MYGFGGPVVAGKDVMCVNYKKVNILSKFAQRAILAACHLAIWSAMDTV